MFQESHSIRFKSNKSFDEVLDVIEDEFDRMSACNTTADGYIDMKSTRFSGFGYKMNVFGRLKKRKDTYKLDMTWDARPSVFAWILGFLFFPIGFLTFLIAHSKKGEMTRKMEDAMDDIQYEIEEKA